MRLAYRARIILGGMGAPWVGEPFAFRFRGSGLQIGLGKGKFAVAPARSIHRDRASNGDAVHPQRPAQLCRRARFRWSSDLSFDALRCRPLRCVGILNGMTAKYATLQNCVSAAQRGILTSREVSGGGLEPPRPLRALAPQASASAIPPPGQGNTGRLW